FLEVYVFTMAMIWMIQYSFDTKLKKKQNKTRANLILYWHNATKRIHQYDDKLR
ncbi:hypothetical protein ACJX0J_010038, partial [Zea mays]